jgi:dCMP deaminase
MKHGPGFWDSYFLQIADVIATASKDPSSKVGAVLVDAQRRIVATGYNGFPQRCDDQEEYYQDREVKLMRVLHAEENAILFSDRPAEVAYCTHPPCAHCTAMMIQKGIKRIVYRKIQMNDSWKKSIDEAKRMAWEAQVDYKEAA